MTNPAEDVVKPGAKPTQATRVSHHRSRHRKRIAARVVLMLALLVGGLAVCHFAYNAYVRADCLTDEETDAWGTTKPAMPKSELCGAELVGRDELLQLDASIVVVAVALLMGSIVMSQKLKPHRR